MELEMPTIVALPPENQMPTIVALPLENPAAGQAARPPVAELPALVPGTCWSLPLRAIQFITTTLALGAMASADDFPTVPAFIFLVAASSLQSLWVILMTFLDMYLLQIGPLGNHWALITLGDVIIPALTFCAASASAGMVLVVRADMRACATTKNCGRFGAAAGMGYISSLTFLPPLFLNGLKFHVIF